MKSKKQDKSKITHGEENEVVNIVSQNDQMIKIIEVLGARDTDLDYSFVEDESVLKYLKQIQTNMEPITDVRKRLSQRYPKTSAQLIELLTQLLEINPYYRPSARECLRNSIFDSIRIYDLEK